MGGKARRPDLCFWGAPWQVAAPYAAELLDLHPLAPLTDSTPSFLPGHTQVAAPYAAELLDLQGVASQRQLVWAELQRQAVEVGRAAAAMPLRVQRIEQTMAQLESGDLRLRWAVFLSFFFPTFFGGGALGAGSAGGGFGDKRERGLVVEVGIPPFFARGGEVGVRPCRRCHRSRCRLQLGLLPPGQWPVTHPRQPSSLPLPLPPAACSCLAQAPEGQARIHRRPGVDATPLPSPPGAGCGCWSRSVLHGGRGCCRW